MATCDLCNQDMLTADSCSVTVLRHGERAFPAIPFGQEPGWLRPPEFCNDCGVRRGRFHHPGCDIQACPRCQGQLLSCHCPWEQLGRPEEDVDEAWDEAGPPGTDEGAPMPRPGLRPVADLAGLVSSLRTQRGDLVSPARRDRPVPLAATAAPVRARHRVVLGEVAAWALARGRSCDLDVAAVCVHVLLTRCPSHRALTRPDVNDLLLTRLANCSVLEGSELPDGWIRDLWTVLGALDAHGRLPAGSDPLAALLEPLQCYGGLDPAGEPLPPGADVALACQCFLPHDPTLPEGMGQHMVGVDGRDGRPYLAVARLQPRSMPADPSDWMPWLTFDQRVTARYHALHSGRTTLAQPDFVGWSPGDDKRPDLWLYRSSECEGECQVLALDHEGRPLVARPDRRRKIGYRWCAEQDIAALVRTGVLRR